MHFPSNNKRRHLDYHKVNPGAHDTSSWWIIRLLSLLIVRSCALLAAVASASNRVIAPKLERQQNKMKKGGEKGIRGFLCSHPLPFLASFLLSSQHSQRTRTETLATQGIWLFVFLSFFLFLLCFFFHTILWKGVGRYNQTYIWRPLWANRWLTAKYRFDNS